MGTKSRTSGSITSQTMLAIALLLVCWAIGAVFYHLVEGLSYVDAIYFTAITLTTVGYGDFAPQTDAGKIFTAVYAFLGIGVFLGFAAAVFSEAMDRFSRKAKR